MKSKWLAMILILLFFIFSAFAVACKNNLHTHSYIQKIVESSCDEEGYVEYICECGNSYIGSYLDKTHDFDNVGICVNCGQQGSVGLSFSLNNGVYSVSIGSCKDENIVIPRTYNDIIVGEIKESAFAAILTNDYRSNIQSVSIPDGVTIIGDRAFDNCYNLQSITIPNSVTTIGDSAFVGCKSVESLIIGNSVTSIGEWAFGDCASLQSITIPNSVTTIGGNAFSNCSKLKSLFIPASVTSIGAMSGCGSLESIKVASGNARYHSKNNCLIETRNKILILGCKNSVIPTDGSVTRIGDAFWGCIDLENITIPNSVTEIGGFAFASCDSLKSVTIPGRVTRLGEYAFAWCDNLKSVTIENGVKSISEKAFEDNKSLESVIIPNSVTSIGEEAFADCESLKYNEDNNGLYLGNSQNPYLALVKVKNIYVKNFEINSNTKCVLSKVFDNCSIIETITIPNSVIGIGENMFFNRIRLKYNEYENGLYLGNSENPYLVFVRAKNTSITSCKINNNTRFILTEAFSNCSVLEEVTIPTSVKNIGNNIFNKCSSLMSVFYNGTQEQWRNIDKKSSIRGNFVLFCSDGNFKLYL